jgi:hypothetical protein
MKYERSTDGANLEQFSVRLTPAQFLALRRRGVTISDRVRGCITSVLRASPWPRYVAASVDEGAGVWVQFRMKPELRTLVGAYQQACGCRDMSAAVRSLVTCALAGEG